MKLFVVLALVAAAAAAPQQRAERQTSGADVQLVRFDSVNDGSGQYRFGFEQTDGHKHSEQGELRNPGAENQFIAVKGSYEWVGPDGVTYIITYTADDNGYQPSIEQGPGGAVPAALIASLAG